MITPHDHGEMHYKAVCVCNRGWGGDQCETPISCAAVRCVGKRKCIMNSGTPTCVCPAGWTGELCDK